LYHKAPDWLGPTVAQELGIPYVVAEASIAPRRANSGWALGYKASRSAIVAASLVLAMTRKDLAGLRGVARGQLAHFPPFLDTSPFVMASAHRPAIRWKLAREHELDAGRPWLLAVAMMRRDVKLLSYRLLANALARITASDWHALLVGDGPARTDIEAEFASLSPGRVRFLGALDPDALAEVYAAADLYVWPACGEAYGMAMLEAQAAGLPV
jgi:glycosyltransferase involved in cell wall biosynthesis